MVIDLKNPSEFTIENVAILIGSKDDSEHRQLRVTTDGIAFLSDDVGSTNTKELAFRLETWALGNGYCGAEAAQDTDWVREVFNDLSENWPHPKSSLIDY